MLAVWLPLINGNRNNLGIINIGTATTGASIVSGKLGNCYQFTRASHHLLIYTLPTELLDKINNHSFGVAAWVKSSSSDAGVWLSITYGMRFGCNDFSLYNSSRSVSASASSGTAADGNWHHIAYTYDVNTNKMTCYRDGREVGSANYTSGYTYASSWTNNINIARDPNNSPDSYYFNGCIQDVRIWCDECPTITQIKEISKGLVLHYTCDDISLYNGKLYDSSGYCNDSTVVGTVTTVDNSARNNKCLNFAGNAYLSPPIFPSFLTNEATVSMWVKLDQLPPSSPGRTMLYTAWYGFSCEIKSNGSTYFRTNLLSGNVDSPSGTMTTGNWIHWVGVKSSTGVSLYLNGTLVGTSSTTSNFNWSSNVNNTIACYSGSYFLYGKLSDIRLYSTALSVDDIKTLYQEAAFIDHKGNIGCYLFYEDSTVDSQIIKTGLVKSGVILEFPRKNLFNKDEFQLNHKNYGGPTKPFEYTAYSGKCCGTAIIKPNTQYVLTCNTSISTTFNTVYWGIDGNIIASYTSGGLQEFVSGVVRTSPNNAYFVSVSNFGSISDANQQALINSILLEEASEASTYVAYDSQHDAEVGQNKIISNQLIEI